jgi:hypothetical protein
LKRAEQRSDGIAAVATMDRIDCGGVGAFDGLAGGLTQSRFCCQPETADGIEKLQGLLRGDFAGYGFFFSSTSPAETRP